MVRLLRRRRRGGGGEHGLAAHGGAAPPALRRPLALRLGEPRRLALRLLPLRSPPEGVLLHGGDGGQLAVGGAGLDRLAPRLGSVPVFFS